MTTPGRTHGLRGLLQPSTLEPVRLDLGVVFRAGIVVWLVAGAVVAVLLGQDRATAADLWTCATGVVLGVLGARWAARRRRTEELPPA